MEQPKNNAKMMAGIMAAILVLSIAGNFYFWDKSRDIAIENEKLEIQANALLSGQSRDINNLNQKIDSANKENTSLTSQLNQLNESIKQKNARLATLNANYTSTASTLNRFRDSVEIERSVWEDQTKNLAAENLSFVNRNTALGNELTLLQERMQEMVPVDVLTVDGFRVKALKKNDKETAKAKKVHTLMVSFQVPPYFNLSGTREVYLSLTDLQGVSLLTPLKTVTVATADAEKVISVHAEKKIDFNQNPQQVGFNLETADEIKPGLYRASVYTKDRYLGAVEFQFRDSFWFF